MQHESSINSDGFDGWPEAGLRHKFQCATGQDGVRDLLEQVEAKIKDINPRASSLSENTQVVLAEVLNNIEEHGYEGAAGGKIGLELQVCDDCILVQTMDFGRAMPGLEPPAKALPASDVALDSLPEGGFGWFLIHTLAPNPRYKRRGNTNMLSMKIIDGPL